VRPDDIVGYTYRADLYCPGCIIKQLPTGPGGAFDGWALAPGVRMSTEANLTEIAVAFGFDRGDESTFDSGEFPKVLFRSSTYFPGQSTNGPDRCGSCGEVLGN
jgi:hypothetical protein